MLELLMNGEIRLSRALKLATVIVPVVLGVMVVLFVKYSVWRERRNRHGKDDFSG